MAHQVTRVDADGSRQSPWRRRAAGCHAFAWTGSRAARMRKTRACRPEPPATGELPSCHATLDERGRDPAPCAVQLAARGINVAAMQAKPMGELGGSKHGNGASRRADCRERPRRKPRAAIGERGRRCRCGRADGPLRRAGPRGSKVSAPTPRGRRRPASTEVICLEFRSIGALGRATARPQACSAVRRAARSNSRRAKGCGSAQRESGRSSGLMPERS